MVQADRPAWQKRLGHACIGTLIIAQVACAPTVKSTKPALPKPLKEDIVLISTPPIPEPPPEPLIPEFYLRLKDNSGGMPPLRSLRFFLRMPYDKIISHLGLEKRRSIQILYPGAGVHIAPLEIGIQLQKRLPRLRSVSYIFTDVGDFSKKIEQFFVPLHPEIAIVRKDSSRYNKRRKRGEIKYHLNALGRNITLTLAIKMSRERDHTFFRKRYAQNSDIILFHDSHAFFHKNAAIRTISMIVRWAAEKGRNNQVVIVEKFKQFHPEPDDPKFEDLPGSIQILKGPYGGCLTSNHDAVLYFSDGSGIQTLK
jgi:hypothetical protein